MKDEYDGKGAGVFMSYLTTKKEELLLSVIINSPEALNTIDLNLLDELNELLDLLKDDNSVRTIIITGAGEKAFSSGLDYSELVNIDPETAYKFACYGQQVFQKIVDLPQPVIAAINGQSIGAGCELALACDLRIASANATFMQPEVSLGIIPCFGGIKRLIQLLGISKAKELLFLGRQITADEAFALGLVNKVVAYGLAHSAARDLAHTLNSLSFYSLSQLKQTINFFATLNSEQISNKEAKNFAACFNFSDHMEGIDAFTTKRKPIFDKNRPGK